MIPKDEKQGFWKNLIPPKGGPARNCRLDAGIGARPPCSREPNDLSRARGHAGGRCVSSRARWGLSGGRRVCGLFQELQAAGAPTGNNETGSPGHHRSGLCPRHRCPARHGSLDRCRWRLSERYGRRGQRRGHSMGRRASDGQVGLFGTSYYGMTQPQVARLRPPALKGLFAIEMCTDFFRHISMFGGAPQLDSTRPEWVPISRPFRLESGRGRGGGRAFRRRHRRGCRAPARPLADDCAQPNPIHPRQVGGGEPPGLRAFDGDPRSPSSIGSVKIERAP